MSAMEPFSAEYRSAVARRQMADAELFELRQAVLSDVAVRQHRVSPRSHWVRGGVAAMAVAAAAAALLMVVLYGGTPTYVIEPQGQSGEEGGWLTSDAQDLSLRFSDGSRVRLHRTSEGRVDLLAREGIRMSLIRGSANFEVIPSGRFAWRIDAGPYRVTVVGTRFSLRWEPEPREFQITLMEGEVQVDGPGLRDQRVSAGQTFSASAMDGRSALSPIFDGDAEAPMSATETNDADVDFGPAVVPRSEIAMNAPILETPSPRIRSRLTSGASSDWQALSRAARYTEALVLARQAGWAGMLQTLPESELFVLAETARLAHAPKDAAQAYEQLRNRFPGSVAAADAAFMLGRMLQRQGRSKEALVWLETCLRERPEGRWTMEAMGRRMEARNETGDLEGARQAAAQYLQRYPSGTHARVAGQILGEERTR